MFVRPYRQPSTKMALIPAVLLLSHCTTLAENDFSLRLDRGAATPPQAPDAGPVGEPNPLDAEAHASDRREAGDGPARPPASPVQLARASSEDPGEPAENLLRTEGYWQSQPTARASVPIWAEISLGQQTLVNYVELDVGERGHLFPREFSLVGIRAGKACWRIQHQAFPEPTEAMRLRVDTEPIDTLRIESTRSRGRAGGYAVSLKRLGVGYHAGLEALRFVANRGWHAPIEISGMRPQRAIDVRRFRSYNRSFHRQSYYDDRRRLRLDLLRSVPGKVAQGIITFAPIMRPGGLQMIYAGWDMDDNGEFLPFVGDNLKRMVKDRIFSVDIKANLLAPPDTWQRGARRHLLQTATASDPSLYHSNDFHLLYLQGKRYRLYYDIQAVDALVDARRKLDPRTWRAPRIDEAGLVTLTMAMSESDDGGRNWHSTAPPNGQPGSLISRANRIVVRGLPQHPSRLIQGWPAGVFVDQGVFHLYYSVSSLNCNRIRPYPQWSDFVAFCDNHDPLPAVIQTAHATSKDGVDFRFQGFLRRGDGTYLRGGGGFVQRINGRYLACVIGSNWLKYGHDPRMNSSYGAPAYQITPTCGVLREDLETVDIYDSNNNGRLDAMGDGLLYRGDPFHPTFRGVNDRIYVDVERRLVLILQGNWNIQYPSALPAGEQRDGYASALYLQKDVAFVDQSTGERFDYVTAHTADAVWLSEAPIASSKSRWIAHTGRGASAKSVRSGRILIADYDGQLLYHTPIAITVRPGDSFAYADAQ